MLEIIYFVLLFGTSSFMLFTVYKLVRYTKKIKICEDEQIIKIVDSAFKLTIGLSFMYLLLAGFNIFLEIQSADILGNWICAFIWINTSRIIQKVLKLLEEEIR